MAADRELKAWHREWGEVFEDMAGAEICVVLQELGAELRGRHWMPEPVAEAWSAITEGVKSRYEADRLTDTDLADIPF